MLAQQQERNNDSYNSVAIMHLTTGKAGWPQVIHGYSLLVCCQHIIALCMYMAHLRTIYGPYLGHMSVIGAYLVLSSYPISAVHLFFFIYLV